MNDQVLRKNVVEFLRGGSAHVTAEAALQNVNPKLRHTRPAEVAHSVWEELEHIRITQEDILRYTLDAANLQDSNVRLNGNSLALTATDELPPIAGAPTTANTVTFKPATITFLAIPAAGNNTCR